MIGSLESETPQNAERGIEAGIPFEVDSRISTDKRARGRRFTLAVVAVPPTDRRQGARISVGRFGQLDLYPPSGWRVLPPIPTNRVVSSLS
jgi:hypothetical protein